MLAAHTTEHTNEIVTAVLFFYVSIWSSLTVASRLPSVLYAITNTSLFEEALSVC